MVDWKDAGTNTSVYLARSKPETEWGKVWNGKNNGQLCAANGR